MTAPQPPALSMVKKSLSLVAGVPTSPARAIPPGTTLVPRTESSQYSTLKDPADRHKDVARNKTTKLTFAYGGVYILPSLCRHYTETQNPASPVCLVVLVLAAGGSGKLGQEFPIHSAPVRNIHQHSPAGLH